MLLHCTIKCILQYNPVILNSDKSNINNYLFAIVISYDYSNTWLIQILINFGYFYILRFDCKLHVHVGLQETKAI